MKKITKLTAMLMAASMLISAAGCGSKTEKGTDAQATAA